MYHINSDSKHSLLAYLNGNLACDTLIKPFKAKKTYNENTIGCKTITEIINKIPQMHLKNNFKGEMSTLFFIKGNHDIFVKIHSALLKIYGKISLHELIPLIYFRESIKSTAINLENEKAINELRECHFVELLIFVVSPKYASQSILPDEKLFVIKQIPRPIIINNHIMILHKQTKIHHNTPARYILPNIGGINCLLPLFYELSELNGFDEPK